MSKKSARQSNKHARTIAKMLTLDKRGPSKLTNKEVFNSMTEAIDDHLSELPYEDRELIRLIVEDELLNHVLPKT